MVWKWVKCWSVSGSGHKCLGQGGSREEVVRAAPSQLDAKEAVLVLPSVFTEKMTGQELSGSGSP